MKRNRKNDQFELIGNVIDRVVRNYRKAPDGELSQIWDLWEGVVGEVIAENARPAAFKGKLLLVHVISSPWLQELRFLKEDIIEKLNKAFGRELVKEIKFKIGSPE